MATLELEDHAREVADQVIAEESTRRRHIVITLSGSHAYGFPSPDSDLDIKASHAAPAERFLGLVTPRSAFDRLEVIEGVEIDYTSNEIGAVIAGVIAGNGNYIERILGELILRDSAELESLRPLVRASLSRRVHRHYRGFGRSQQAAFNESDGPTAKTLLYVLRTALTGRHLLETGELRVDLNDTAPLYGLADAAELIAAKRAGERVVLEESLRESWRGRLGKVFSDLDKALASSVLPEEPPNADDLEAWLVETRRSELEASLRRQ